MLIKVVVEIIIEISMYIIYNEILMYNCVLYMVIYNYIVSCG